MGKKIINNLFEYLENIGCKKENIKYIKSGTYGHVFRANILINGKETDCAIKFSPYAKKNYFGSINDIRRPENSEIKMAQTLSNFLFEKRTEHVLLPINNFNTPIKQLLEILRLNMENNGNVKNDEKIKKQKKKYKEFMKNYKEKKYHNIVSVFICEWADNGDLLAYLKNNYNNSNFSNIEWKVIFFQLFSVLSVIQNKYPSFRHNDLKANNILLTQNTSSDSTLIYNLGERKYRIPNLGYNVKLCDFDFACIPGIVDNQKVGLNWTKKLNIVSKQNRYYDINYFFNTLKNFIPKLMETIPEETRNFINRIVPEKYSDFDLGNVTERGRVLNNDEYLIPENILYRDPYFDEFGLVEI